ncbi:hypothetical protein GGR56DRAFT_14268 [Xylariaceae sp. FL0804]|nr:hypothetical protein GGR56DRAFT_14268 [Xylariaceae sp. FL0804]
MEPLRLKQRKPVEDVVENWDDDDDFMIDNDEDLSFRSHSTNNPHNQLQHASRRASSSSFRSERDSLPGGDERHVHLPVEDEKSTLDAIAAAAHAGIPIPTNVPPSALTGGTIKRLGGRKIKKIFQEDWGEDLELPASGQTLCLKAQDGIKFPEVLRQVSGSTSTSPIKQLFPTPAPVASTQETRPKTLAEPINLDRFRDTDDDDDVFGDGSATIKAPKLLPLGAPLSLVTPPTPSPMKRKEAAVAEDDNFENDLELPSDGKLKLSSKRDIPKTPSLQSHDDFDWVEGSLGTRFGGTKRDAFSNRSSSVSALSPSVASSITAESEDEAFDGLVLPMGPLDLGERLQRRKKSESPERRESQLHQLNKHSHSSNIQLSPKSQSPKDSPVQYHAAQHAPVKQMLSHAKDEDDMFSGLEFGDGNVFRRSKPTVHRNIKVKESRPMSPVRPKAAVSITFSTNKSASPITSRLPRPTSNHERSHTQSSLEPVWESGPIPQKANARSHSRLGHSSQSSVASAPTPTTLSHPTLPSTPRRRELGQKASTGALRNEPTTTSAQLLRLKRSLPAMRQSQSPAKPTTSRFERPSSRTDSRAEMNRPPSALQHRAAVDRSRQPHESNAALARKGQAPFLPAGASASQSYNVNAAKSSRSFRRRDSDQGPDVRPLSRAYSRTTIRSPSPKKMRNEKSAAEPVWQQINKPRRARQFGDGHELDAFDDLPTSAQNESKFTKPPVGCGNRTNIRNKLYQNVLPDRNTPSPVAPGSPARLDQLPHFARDTAASRNAREAGLAQRAQPSGPLAPLTSVRVAQLSRGANLNPQSRSKKTRKPPQLKPHLISNLNSAKDTKVVKGMTYNPATFRWEGNDNDNALTAFDVPASSPSTSSLPPHMIRDRDTSTPRPVLITQINASKNAKRVGDMVFDPQNMCWLKVDISTPTTQRTDDPMEGFNALEEEDPFKGIPDLETEKTSAEGGHGGRASDIIADWLVGEEFDVGPEFIKRQHDEEARWRRKCSKWMQPGQRDQAAWRHRIRDLVMGMEG